MVVKDKVNRIDILESILPLLFTKENEISTKSIRQNETNKKRLSPTAGESQIISLFALSIRLTLGLY